MVVDVKTADVEETVLNAAEKMNKHEIGCIVVTKDEKPVGIVTERDLLKRVLSARKNPCKTRLNEIMSTRPVCVKPNTTIGKAAQVMINQRIKKLLVVKNERLSGIISLTDLVTAMRKNNSTIKLSLNGAPKKFKKAFEMHDIDAEERRCPQIILGGSLINCLGPKCAWFVDGGCKSRL